MDVEIKSTTITPATSPEHLTLLQYGGEDLNQRWSSVKVARTCVHVELELLGTNVYLCEKRRYYIKIWLFLKTICAPQRS